MVSQLSSDDSSDGIEAIFDPRQQEGYIVTRQKSQGRSQGNGSQGPSNYSQVLVTGRCLVNAEVKEFGAVEQTMQIGEKPQSKRRQHKSRNHLQSDYSSTAIEMPASSPSLDSDPIQSTFPHEQERVNHESRPQYKGTARIPPLGTMHARSTTRFRGQRENGGQSRHLNSSSQSRKYFNVDDQQDSSNSKVQGNPDDESSYAKNLFLDSRGQRRGEVPGVDRNSSISSDELASTTIVGDRKTSPAKNSRPNSPIKSSSSQKAVSSLSSAAGLKPSIIPTTTFTSARIARPTKIVPAQRTTYPGENEAPWAIGLTRVNVAGGAGEPFRGPSLGLVFKDISKTYEVQKDGQSLTTMNSSLQIQPKKLLKVFWAPKSRKVRFLFSKSGNHDNILDIEMDSEKGVYDLLTRLLEDSHGSHKVVICEGYVMFILILSPWSDWTYTIDRDHMDKLFETRQSQCETYSRKADISGSNVPQDIQLAARNKERRDKAQDKPSEPESCKRRRGRDEADQDVSKPRLSRGMRQCLRGSKSGPIFDQHPEEEKPDNNGRGSMENILGRIHSKPPNPHLRVLRNKSHLERRNSSAQSPSEESPRHLRYSVIEGLGNPWSKPLLYPKTGKKKISVEWIDLERLDEGEFLNDNLIAFYLRLLQDQLEEKSPELAKRVYFFNTFFFASLTNTQRGKKGINYEAVQKWTRSVNIFSYDYVVVPINESAHWYVAIICNLPALASIPDIREDIPKDEPPLSPSDRDDPDGLSTRPLCRDFSPTANVSVEGSFSLFQETENPVEQAPSASFAEMSLEPGPEKRSGLVEEVRTVQNAACNSTSDGVGQDMLDMQITGNMAESAALDQRGASLGDVEWKEMKDEVTIVQSQAPKASPISRKRKRKSIPPTQRTDPTSTLILTFDSLGLAHPVTVRSLKDYLLAEGRAKREMELEVSRIKGMTAKQIPQQDNMCDCGLFLLGYIDKFLVDPKDFITKVIGQKYDLEKDWSKLIPSDLRASIREQIQALYAEQESESRDERRESAKRANKYHERPLQHWDADPPSNPIQLKPNPWIALERELKAAARKPSPERPPTTETELKTATPISETLARQDFDILDKPSNRSRSTQIYQNSSDPLHQDVDIIVHRSPSPLLPKESSPIVMESQLDSAVNKGTTSSEPYSATYPRSRSISVELPSTIEDSQPSPFQDLLAGEKVNSKTSPPPSNVETEDQRSANRNDRTEVWGSDFDECITNGPRTKQTAPESVETEHQLRSSRGHKKILVHEIVDLSN